VVGRTPRLGSASLWGGSVMEAAIINTALVTFVVLDLLVAWMLLA
jgi:hypothetical protein